MWSLFSHKPSEKILKNTTILQRSIGPHFSRTAQVHRILNQNLRGFLGERGEPFALLTRRLRTTILLGERTVPMHWDGLCTRCRIVNKFRTEYFARCCVHYGGGQANPILHLQVGTFRSHDRIFDHRTVIYGLVGTS